MYILQTNLTGASLADFYNLLFGQGATIEHRVSSLTNIFRNLSDKFELVRSAFGNFIADNLENPSVAIPTELQNVAIPFDNDDHSEIAYAPLNRVAAAIQNAMSSDDEPDLQSNIRIELDQGEYIDTTIEEAANKVAGMTDCMILQTAAFQSTLSESYSDACAVIDDAMDRVSQYSTSALLSPVAKIKSFYQTHWNSGTHSLVLFVASLFGLDRNDANAASLYGDGELNVWAGITGFSAFANMVAGFGAFFSTIGTFIWKVVSTIVQAVFKVLNFVIKAITGLFKFLMKKFDDFIFKSTVGTGIISTSNGYGWSSTYSKRFIIPANSYVCWYMYTHDYLDDDGYTFMFLNVRFNVKYKSNDFIPKTVTWQDWYSHIEQYQIVLLGTISVAPIYGPNLFNYSLSLGNQGMFQLCSSNLTMGKTSQDQVQNSDFDNGCRPWAINQTECEVLIDCLNSFNIQNMLPESQLDTRDVAESFLYGHGMANLVLACPFKDIVFDNETPFDALTLPDSVKEWLCLLLQQLYFWGCIYVSQDAAYTNCLAKGYTYERVPNYGAYRTNSTLYGGWKGKYWACIPFDYYPHLINYLGDVPTTDPNYATFASNKWFAQVISQARKIDTKTTSDQLNGYNDVYTDMDNWRDGMLSYEIYGTVNSALFRSLDNNGVDYFSFFDGIRQMVLNSWNRGYPGTFIPGSPEPLSNSDTPYYILTDAEEQSTVAAYTSIIATKVIVAAVVIAAVAISIKLFKTWRSAKFVADTAAFNYGDAIARGATADAAAYLKTYKKAHLVDSMLGFFSPAKVAGASTAIMGSIPLSSSKTAASAAAEVSDDIGGKIDAVHHLIV